MPSLRRRLILWLVAATVVAIVGSAFVARELGSALNDLGLDRGEAARGAVAAYEEGGAGAFEAYRSAYLDRGVDLMLFRGRRPEAMLHLPPPLRPVLPKLLAGPDRTLELLGGEEVFVVNVASGDGPPWQVVGFRPPGARGRAPAWVPLLAQILLAIAVLAAVGWYLSQALAGPLASMSDAVRRFASGELGARVGGHLAREGGEVALLAREFDAMAERIQTLMAQRDLLLHQISHELRSPLARLTFSIELAEQEPAAAGKHLTRARLEVDRLDALVGEIVGFLRIGAGLETLELAELEVTELAAEAIDAARIECEERGIRLVLETGAAARVAAHRGMLGRALDNVLRNAVRHSPDGGEVRVRVAQDGASTTIEVLDRGPGVSAGELPRLFEPFFRGQAARGTAGHGLGLAITAQILRAHGGEARARNREGGGLTVTLSLAR